MWSNLQVAPVWSPHVMILPLIWQGLIHSFRLSDLCDWYPRVNHISLLPSTVSPTYHSFHMPLPLLLLLLLPPPLWVAHCCHHMLSVRESHCHTGLWYLSAHLSSLVSPIPRCPGNIRRGLEVPSGGLMTSASAHSFRATHRLDLCQVKQ